MKTNTFSLSYLIPEAFYDLQDGHIMLLREGNVRRCTV